MRTAGDRAAARDADDPAHSAPNVRTNVTMQSIDRPVAAKACSKLTDPP
jgi:hypothetical protein